MNLERHLKLQAKICEIKKDQISDFDNALGRVGKMMRYYDIAGKRITMGQWGFLSEREKYKRIGYDSFEMGDQVYEISTIWIGMGLSISLGPPEIFETMVFGIAEEGSMTFRYSTFAEAQTGHRVLVPMVGVAAELSSGPDAAVPDIIKEQISRVSQQQPREYE